MSGVKKVIGRPAEAESYRWDGDYKAFPAEWRGLDLFTEQDDGSLLVRTLRGPVPCRIGEYVIRRKAGDFYPIDEFTYAERWAEQ